MIVWLECACQRQIKIPAFSSFVGSLKRPSTPAQAFSVATGEITMSDDRKPEKSDAQKTLEQVAVGTACVVAGSIVLGVIGGIVGGPPGAVLGSKIGAVLGGGAAGGSDGGASLG